jgi:hypothetical protein
MRDAGGRENIPIQVPAPRILHAPSSLWCPATDGRGLMKSKGKNG